MAKSKELKAALMKADPMVRDFVELMEKEILRLHKANISLELKNTSAKLRIDALEKTLKQYAEVDKDMATAAAKIAERVQMEAENLKDD